MVRRTLNISRKAALLAGAAALLGFARPAAAVPTYQFAGTIPIPVSSFNTTGTFIGYDLSTFDATNQLYYLTDRSNNGIDVFSSATNSFVERLGTGLFTGNLSPASGAGPNGISISTLNDGSRLLPATAPATSSRSTSPPTGWPSPTPAPSRRLWPARPPRRTGWTASLTRPRPTPS